MHIRLMRNPQQIKIYFYKFPIGLGHVGIHKFVRYDGDT